MKAIIFIKRNSSSFTRNSLVRNSIHRLFSNNAVIEDATSAEFTHRMQINDSIGLFRTSEHDDIQVLVNNFTAPSLARALRDRESTLQTAAKLVKSGEYDALAALLRPFEKDNVERRRKKRHELDLSNGFTRRELVIIQRYLHRMPRQVYHAVERRASVVIPLCNVSGVASVLFEVRSSKVRTYKHQVCFPGGMVDEGVDGTIIQTSLRELEEEIGIPNQQVEVLGVLRCNWQQVAKMTGIAVTPVVGFIGELDHLELKTNADEVDSLFTIPIVDLLDESKWTNQLSAPTFTSEPYNVWGLTAYLLHRFVMDIIKKSPKVEAKLEGNSPLQIDDDF